MGRLPWNRWHGVMLVYTGFIYSNSLKPSTLSSQESGLLLVKLELMLKALGWNYMWITEHMVRKTAHFVEYAGLGCILVLAYGIWTAPVPAGMRRAGELAFLIPFVDETIQLFVPGRSGQISDVWLDLCGAVCGMLLMMCVKGWLQRRRLRKGQVEIR